MPIVLGVCFDILRGLAEVNYTNVS